MKHMNMNTTEAKAIELHHADGRSAGIFYCSECRIVYKTKEEAESCHGTLVCECGKPSTSRHQRECSLCLSEKWRKEESVREFARYQKATKIPAKEWDGGVFFNDVFYHSVEDLMDYLEDYPEGEEYSPEYVWAAQNVGVPTVDLEDCLQNVVEHMWEDADYSDLHGVDEFQAAIDAFNKANEAVQVWQEDTKTAIVLEARLTAVAEVG